MFVVYNLLVSFLAPFWVPWMLLRANRRKEKPNWAERQGRYELPSGKGRRRIWIHAVSVGEVVAAVPILRELRRRLPRHEIILTTTTSSGQRTAREHAVDLYDHLFYFPMDVARFQLSAMQRVRPEVVAIMETELWMNFLWAAKTFDARTLLVNGRISDRSFRRAKGFRFFYSALLRDVDRCLMQSDVDAERIRALGAREAEVVGNTKFDEALEGTRAEKGRWQTELGLEARRRTVVFGSVRAEEFGFVAQALKMVHADGVQIVIAPRHLERTTELLAALEETGFAGPYARRSQGERMGENGLLILDSYGELGQVYAVADVVVVGGGFAELGGQNILQPLAHGKPVIHGPNMGNFREAADLAAGAAATRIAATPEELAAGLDALLGDAEARKRMGAAARALVDRNVGAAARYVDAIVAETERFTEIEAERQARIAARRQGMGK